MQPLKCVPFKCMSIIFNLYICWYRTLKPLLKHSQSLILITHFDQKNKIKCPKYLLCSTPPTTMKVMWKHIYRREPFLSGACIHIHVCIIISYTKMHMIAMNLYNAKVNEFMFCNYQCNDHRHLTPYMKPGN